MSAHRHDGDLPEGFYQCSVASRMSWITPEISSAERAVCLASDLTPDANAKPLPASPVRVASVASSASRSVRPAILCVSVLMLPIFRARTDYSPTAQTRVGF
jgi:hypothetical protein